MKGKIYPDKKNLYRMPWSTNDNPIGWLEVTDICNIKCKGCYRLIMGEGHKTLEQLKEEILFLKKWRNCDNISLAGGEPILHPQIVELIEFISSLGMKSVMLTNGVALNDDILKKLKKAGLFGLSFHIDSTQSRPEFNRDKIKNEMELNDLRLKFAKMLYKYKFYAHFGITVTPDSLKEVPDFIKWVIQNSKYINGVSLIIYRGLLVADGIHYYANNKELDMKAGDLGYAVGEDERDAIKIRSEDVYAVLKEHFPDYEASAYLGGTHDHTSFKWLIGSMFINSKGKTFGAYGKRIMEIAQMWHHLFKGAYLVYPQRKIGKEVFIMSIFDKTIRKAFWKFLKYVLGNPIRLFYPMSPIGIGMVQAPDLLDDGNIDMCDDCPDMCVHEGKLVNSCRLDECRIYGHLLHVQVDEGALDKKKEEKVLTEELSEN